MIRKIKLRGHLGRKFGKEFSFNVESPAEAIQALRANLPGFRHYMIKHSSPGYRVVVGESRVMDRDALAKCTGAETISFVPVVRGAGSSKSIGQIFAGIVLITVGVITSNPYLVATGASVGLGGIAGLMMPVPVTHGSTEAPEDRPSHTFSGVVNTKGQGNVVPIFYGEGEIGGQLISAGFSTDRINPALYATNSSPDRGDASIRAQGSGGGGKSGGEVREAQTAPNTLSSTMYFRGQIALCEGEIEGLVDGLKSVFIDGVPIQNADGSFNYTDVIHHLSLGIPDQIAAPGFTDTESERAVGLQVKKTQSIVKRINNKNVDAVRVIMLIPKPGLHTRDMTNGDLNPASVTYAVDVQENDGGFVQKVLHTISDRMPGPYNKTHRIDLSGDGPWDIRVRRITDDHDDDEKIQDQIWWSSYTEIFEIKQAYPNTVVASIQIGADQFRQIPKNISHRIRGTRIRVFSNYDPPSRSYIGLWDGELKTAWTNNAPLILADLLLDERYGVGQYVNLAKIDKWSLYEAARYSDGMLDNGQGTGSKEPRYTFNGPIQAREEAFYLLNYVAASFAGRFFWNDNKIKFTQDRPMDPVALFSEGNVTEEGFSYSTSERKKTTIAHVQWSDPENHYNTAVETVEDDEGIEIYGRNEQKISPRGLTSRGQAQRTGRALIYAELHQSDLINFSVGLDAAYLEPGDVFQTQDIIRSGEKWSGRILDFSKVSGVRKIRLDKKVTLEANKVYAVSCVLPDLTIERRDVVNSPEETDLLVLSSDFSKSIQVHAVWVLSEDNLVPEEWMVSNIEWQSGTRLGISGVKYIKEKFAAIEEDIKFAPKPTFTPLDTLQKPRALEVTERLINVQGKWLIIMTIGWEAVPEAMRFNVRYRRFNDLFTPLPETTNRWIEVEDIIPGRYEIEVTATNVLGVKSLPATIFAEILGTNLISVMPDVKNLRLRGEDTSKKEFVGKTPSFEWDPIRPDGLPENAILEGYEIRIYDDKGNFLFTKDTKNNFFTFDIEENIEGTGFDTPPTLPERMPVIVTPISAKAYYRVSGEAILSLAPLVPIVPSLQSAKAYCRVSGETILAWPSITITPDPLIVYCGVSGNIVLGGITITPVPVKAYCSVSGERIAGWPSVVITPAPVVAYCGVSGETILAWPSITITPVPLIAFCEVSGRIIPVWPSVTIAQIHIRAYCEVSGDAVLGSVAITPVPAKVYSSVSGNISLRYPRHTINQGKGTGINNSISKFGGGSIALSGTDSAMWIEDHDDFWIGKNGGPFTIDFWFRHSGDLLDYYSFNTLGSPTSLWMYWRVVQDTTPWFRFAHIPEGELSRKFFNSSSFPASALDSQGRIPESQFNHYALVGDGNEVFFFLNGKKISAYHLRDDPDRNIDEYGPLENIDGRFWVAGRPGVTSKDMVGNLEEFRISNVARWTQDFTPPTTRYSRDSSTKLLIRVEDDNIIDPQ